MKCLLTFLTTGLTLIGSSSIGFMGPVATADLTEAVENKIAHLTRGLQRRVTTFTSRRPSDQYHFETLEKLIPPNSKHQARHENH